MPEPSIQAKPNLINRNKTWRNVICLNPRHETIQLHTNEIGTISCPICGGAMVVLVRPVIEHELD